MDMTLKDYREVCAKTGVGTAFLEWFDTTDAKAGPEDIEVYMSAFLAGDQYHHDQIAAVLRQGDGRHEVIEKEIEHEVVEKKDS